MCGARCDPRAAPVRSPAVVLRPPALALAPPLCLTPRAAQVPMQRPPPTGGVASTLLIVLLSLGIVSFFMIARVTPGMHRLPRHFRTARAAPDHGRRQPSYHFAVGVGNRPHPDKTNGGEDAFHAGHASLALFDGVGGWAEAGVDAGVYAKELAGLVTEFVTNRTLVPPPPPL